MTVTIEGLRPTQLKKLEQLARGRRQTTSQYLRALVEDHIELAETSFDEILAPARTSARRKGVTAAAVEKAINKARRAFWRKETARRRKR
jgi:predicted transcriptional regulator